MDTYTLIHVVLSLVGIFSGLIVLGGMLSGGGLPAWTFLFLLTTAATSATGFGFKFEHILPSHIVGGVSLILLALAAYARYGRGLNGHWRKVYIIGALVALYLNIFVFIAQAFQKVKVLNDWAPTQSSPPFQMTQLAVLGVFVILIILANVRYRS
jgi:hypothetical protein